MATLLELKTKTRERSDMERSTFISDSELVSYINMAYSELYDILVSRFEDYFSEKVLFTLSSTNEYTLPANFYKLRGLDFKNNGDRYVVVKKWNFEERNQVSDDVTNVYGQYQAWIIPRITQLAIDADVTADIMDFEEYIIVCAAIMMKDKEESDVSVLMAAKQMLKNRIEGMGSNRDSTPDRISDVHSSEFYGRSWNDRKYRIMGNKLIVLPIAREKYSTYFTGF